MDIKEVLDVEIISQKLQKQDMEQILKRLFKNQEVGQLVLWDSENVFHITKIK
jgi:hypothetical protein